MIQKKQSCDSFAGSLILLWNCSILETSNFYHEKKNSKIAFRIKSLKNQAETNFKSKRFKREKTNFCLFNYKKIRMREFHTQTNVKYYTQKCRFQQKNLFYGFKNNDLVEIIHCQSYVYDIKWTFEKFLEEEIQQIIEYKTKTGTFLNTEQKLEIYTYENHYKSFEQIRLEFFLHMNTYITYTRCPKKMVQ